MNEFLVAHRQAIRLAIGQASYATSVVIPEPISMTLFGGRQHFRENLLFEPLSMARDVRESHPRNLPSDSLRMPTHLRIYNQSADLSGTIHRIAEAQIGVT